MLPGFDQPYIFQFFPVPPDSLSCHSSIFFQILCASIEPIFIPPTISESMLQFRKHSIKPLCLPTDLMFEDISIKL